MRAKNFPEDLLERQGFRLLHGLPLLVPLAPAATTPDRRPMSFPAGCPCAGKSVAPAPAACGIAGRIEAPPPDRQFRLTAAPLGHQATRLENRQGGCPTAPCP